MFRYVMTCSNFWPESLYSDSFQRPHPTIPQHHIILSFLGYDTYLQAYFPPTTSPSALDPIQLDPTLSQAISPERTGNTNIEEIKDEGAAKDDGVELPRDLLGHADFGDDDCPGQDPEEVGAEGLVEEPAGSGGKEDGGELVLHGVEYVAPVDVLEEGGSRLVGRAIGEGIGGTGAGRKGECGKRIKGRDGEEKDGLTRHIFFVISATLVELER